MVTVTPSGKNTFLLKRSFWVFFVTVAYKRFIYYNFFSVLLSPTKGLIRST